MRDLVFEVKSYLFKIFDLKSIFGSLVQPDEHLKEGLVISYTFQLQFCIKLHFHL